MSSTIPSSTAAAPTTSAAAPPSAAALANASSGATVTSTGIGSGLNIGAIVSSLTTSYGAAQQNQLTNRANALDSQVSAFGTFTSALDTLQGTLSALETPSTLAGFTANIADKTIATATASSAAVAGTYTLAVQNLATSATLTSAALSTSTAIGTGTLKINVGGSSASITIDSAHATLAGIAAAINGASNNPGVSASVLTSTDGSRLVLSSTSTGAANAITVTQSGGGGGLASIAYDPSHGVTGGLTQTQAAADANFTINGFAGTSGNNVVSGALSGVTLNLVGASAAGATTTLNITPDTTAAQKSITGFLTAVNGALSAVKTLTAYDPTTQTAGPLQGNATLEAFQSQLENILGTVSSTNAGGVSSLTDLGITSNAGTGQLDTDTTKLGTALSASLGSIGTLLGGANGIATQIDHLVTQYTQSGGILSTINQGLQSGLTNISTQQTALNAQLASYSATLTAQYNAVDTTIALLKQTQNYLTAEFNPNAGSSSSSSSLSSGTTST